jgi:MHS family proline/betaine transporter-like MFS transporter
MQADALRSFVLLISLVICYSVFYQILYIWMPGFLEVNLHYSASAVLGLNTINMVIFVGSILLFGYVSDYVPLQRLLIIASSLLLLLSYPFFLWILQAQSLWLIAVGLVIMTLIFGMYAASTTRQVVNLFPISNRYTGLSLGYNLAYAIFGGTTPLMVTWLVKATGQLHSPAYYLMACALLVSVLMLLTKRQMAK